MTLKQLRPGMILRLGRAASVQFTQPITLRLVGVENYGPTYEGWAWLTGYQLNKAGKAVEHRSLFVLLAGLRVAP